MGGILFCIPIYLVSWLEGAPTRVSLQFCGAFLVMYFIIRILANLIKDHDLEVERYWNNRKHFSRPSFSMSYDSKTGKHTIKSGPDPDHATRCQNSLRDWYDIERRVKLNNWIYGMNIILLVLCLEHL